MDSWQPADALSFQVLALLKLEQTEHIFTGLIELKKNTQKTYEYLQQSDSYQPELFYTAILLKQALSHLPNDYRDMPSCNDLRLTMEYDYRTLVEEQELPIPLLWQALSKVCMTESS